MFLVGHSLGPALNPVTQLMRNDEYGDRVSRLVQRHWPKTWQLLREGAGMPNDFGLLTVRTNENHWFVGGFLHSRQPDVVDVYPAALDRFRDLAFDVAGDALGWPTNLPGLIDILATDRGSDQLRTTAAVADNLASILREAATIFR